MLSLRVPSGSLTEKYSKPEPIERTTFCYNRFFKHVTKTNINMFFYKKFINVV